MLATNKSVTLVLIVGIKGEARSIALDYTVVPLRKIDAAAFSNEGFTWLENRVKDPTTYFFKSKVSGEETLSLAKRTAHPYLLHEREERGVPAGSGVMMIIEMDTENECFHLLTNKGVRQKKP